MTIVRSPMVVAGTRLTQEMIEEFQSTGDWSGRLLTDYLDEGARSFPEKIAFVDARREITYGALRSETDRCAQGLVALGVGPGDVVSVQLPNWIEWVVLFLATKRIGAVLNTLVPIYRERELKFMLDLARPKVLVVPREFRGFDHAQMMQSLVSGLPCVQHILVIGDPLEGTEQWADFATRAWENEPDAVDLDARRPDPNDITLLIFTSGTTGEPKGVMHTHNTLGACTSDLPRRQFVTSDTVVHMASTMGHLTGLLWGAQMTIQEGATCILQEKWSAGEFVELVERHKITYTTAATPFLSDLLGLQDLAEHDVSSLQRFVCAGAPIPRAMVRLAKERLPNLVVAGGWGQTENGLVTASAPTDPPAKIIDSDGYPLKGMAVRVVDQFGNPLPVGAEGRLEAKGAYTFIGYAYRAETTAESFDGEWFRTGDLAVVDEQGYLRITGRTKDVIIRGGENIPVAYIENVLFEHPNISDVAVVGTPDPRLQERACACIVLAPDTAGITLEEIQEFLGSRGVARQYWPERLEVLAGLPRTASGKIQKFVLRQEAAELVQRDRPSDR